LGFFLEDSKMNNEIDSVPLCACGCGSRVIWSKQNKKWNKFIKYHHVNGISLSEEHKKKLSEAHTGKKLSEEHKRNIGKAGRNPSEETRQKLREAHRGRKFMEETKRKIKEAKLGHSVSEETREKLRIANSNPSEETRLKMSKAKKGRKLSKKSIIKRTVTYLENRQKEGKTKVEGYCNIWGDKDYIIDLRKGACELCGITNMMSIHLFGENLIIHHTNGKDHCAPWETLTLCRGCHTKLHWELRREEKLNS